MCFVSCVFDYCPKFGKLFYNILSYYFSWLVTFIKFILLSRYFNGIINGLDLVMLPKCSLCGKVVYPVEQLKCLDQVRMGYFHVRCYICCKINLFTTYLFRGYFFIANLTVRSGTRNALNVSCVE